MHNFKIKLFVSIILLFQLIVASSDYEGGAKAQKSCDSRAWGVVCGVKRMFDTIGKEQVVTDELRANLEDLKQVARANLLMSENAKEHAPNDLKYFYVQAQRSYESLSKNKMNEDLFLYVWQLLTEHYQLRPKELQRLLQSDASKIRAMEEALRPLKNETPQQQEQREKKKKKCIESKKLTIGECGVCLRSAELPLVNRFNQVYNMFDYVRIGLGITDHWMFVQYLDWWNRHTGKASYVDSWYQKNSVEQEASWKDDHVSDRSALSAIFQQKSDIRSHLKRYHALLIDSYRTMLPGGATIALMQVKADREAEEKRNLAEFVAKEVAARKAKLLAEKKREAERELMQRHVGERSQIVQQVKEEKVKLQADLLAQKELELQELVQKEHNAWLKAKFKAWYRSVSSFLPVFVMNRRNAEAMQEHLVQRAMQEEFTDDETIVEEQVILPSSVVIAEQRRRAEEKAMLAEDSRAQKLVTRDARLKRRQDRRDAAEQERLVREQEQQEDEEWKRVSEIARTESKRIEQSRWEKCKARCRARSLEQWYMQQRLSVWLAWCLGKQKDKKRHQDAVDLAKLNEERARAQRLKDAWKNWIGLYEDNKQQTPDSDVFARRSVSQALEDRSVEGSERTLVDVATLHLESSSPSTSTAGNSVDVTVQPWAIRRSDPYSLSNPQGLRIMPSTTLEDWMARSHYCNCRDCGWLKRVYNASIYHPDAFQAWNQLWARGNFDYFGNPMNVTHAEQDCFRQLFDEQAKID